jgi:HEAT repeat protein
LLFLRNQTAVAQPFDLDRLELNGNPTPIAESVSTENNRAEFTVSGHTLADRVQSSEGRRSGWYDRTGKLPMPSSPCRPEDPPQPPHQVWPVQRDKESEVVFSASSALFQLGDPTAYQVYYAVLTGQRKTGEPLLESQMEMLKDPNTLAKVGFEAGIGFIPFGGIVYKAFKSFRQDNVSPVRAAAAQRLAADPDPNTGKALAAATADEKWIVRAAAISAIAKRGDASLLPAAAARLDDEQAVVRFNAAAAVVRLSKAPKR